MKSSTVLQVIQISKRFGGLQALSNIDIEVMVGEIVGIIGPNGSGKTTLFNIITGVYDATQGQVVTNDIEITGMSQHRITSLGLARTFQNIRLFPKMTVLDNIMVGMHLHSKIKLRDLFPHRKESGSGNGECESRAVELMKSLDLYDLRYQLASNLPYGLQRKLEIARALATKPKLLLLDEPAAGMNENETLDLMNIVKKLRNEGFTILLIEHDMRFVMGICDRIYAMDHGLIIANGTPVEIQQSPVVIDAYLGISED